MYDEVRCFANENNLKSPISIYSCKKLSEKLHMKKIVSRKLRNTKNFHLKKKHRPEN